MSIPNDHDVEDESVQLHIIMNMTFLMLFIIITGFRGTYLPLST